MALDAAGLIVSNISFLDSITQQNSYHYEKLPKLLCWNSSDWLLANFEAHIGFLADTTCQKKTRKKKKTKTWLEVDVHYGSLGVPMKVVHYYSIMTQLGSYVGWRLEGQGFQKNLLPPYYPPSLSSSTLNSNI